MGDVLRSFRAPQFKSEVDHLDSKKIDQTSESYDFWRRGEHTEVIKLTKKKKERKFRGDTVTVFEYVLPFVKDD